MVYQQLAPFDPNRDFVALTFFRSGGHPVERDANFDKASVEPRLLRILYETHKIGYKAASADETAGELAPATIEELGGGWWAVGAPWLDAAEKVQGRDKAIFRAQQIRNDGEPDDHHGVALVPFEGNSWLIKARWAADPEKLDDEGAARARADELRKAGPPADWVSPDTPIGSPNFEATQQIGGKAVPLSEIIASALEASGQEVRVWNALSEEDRDALIKAEVDRRTAGASGAPGGTDSGGAA